MFVDRIENGWLKYRLGRGDPAAAFLWVIRHVSAQYQNKFGMLREIEKNHRNNLAPVTSEDMFRAFEYLASHLRMGNKILVPEELAWIARYTGSQYREDMESLIYESLVSYSEFWDRARRMTVWTLSLEKQRAIIQNVLIKQKMGAKRKAQLTRELGDSGNEHTRAYFFSLVNDGHYRVASSLSLPAAVVEEIVMERIRFKIDDNMVGEALVMAEYFLKSRPEIIAELRGFERALC